MYSCIYTKYIPASPRIATRDYLTYPNFPQSNFFLPRNQLQFLVRTFPCTRCPVLITWGSVLSLWDRTLLVPAGLCGFLL